MLIYDFLTGGAFFYVNLQCKSGFCVLKGDYIALAIRCVLRGTAESNGTALLLERENLN